ALDIAKAYGDQQVLHDVDLSVREGEILGIIGPSGSGKSTLLRLLDLIEPPTSGELHIFGMDVLEERGHWLALRRRMGMLFQKPIVFNTNVYQNVALGLQYRGIGRREIEKRVNEALEAVGLSRYIKSKAKDLSGGEQQRVALSRVLVTKPEILFLDEPTANLDPTSTATIEKIVRDMNREEGVTVVMNTHDMLQGQRLSNRIGVMIGGTIVQEGPPHEVFQTPKTSSIAKFVGIENILAGHILSSRDTLTTVDVEGHDIISRESPPDNVQEVDVLIRGEDIDIRRQKPEEAPDRNTMSCEVTALESLPPYVRVHLSCGTLELAVLMTTRVAAERELDTGVRAWATFRAEAVHLVPREK
ncbi:MAG TPA: ABC transporter ATP-binding protein, partial [Methanomicrobiales archaeon]|nr:ABC transporter ATP-binding protein [Methanomicrobiales archaeon]